MKSASSLIALLLLFQLNIAFAQLNKGEKAPDIIFENTFPINYKLPKGKPIILDFWATWCAPCVAALHESNTFVERYKDKIEFLCISDSTSKNVEKFIDKQKLKHQFLVNKNQTTLRNFKIKGLPTVYFIDANGIIQWSGNGMSVNSKLIDEFLETGKISGNTDSNSLTFSSIKKGTGDFTFDLSEIKSGEENSPPGVMMGSKGDSISYAIQNIPLRGILELLYKNQTKQIIYNLKNPELINKHFTLSAFAKKIDPKTIDYTLLKMIGTKQNFNVSIKETESDAWVFKKINESKFNSYKTKLDLSIGNSEDFNFHIGKDDKGKLIMSGINLKLIDFQSTVSEIYDTLIVFENIDLLGYDFDNICLSDFEVFKNQMLETYGLKLVKEKVSLPFLLIEN
jgi:cytochrome c biogenesis protein CcmG/thiol:disulfide interchange protein DsbE